MAKSTTMRLTIGTKLFVLFGAMIILFISFTCYVSTDLKKFESDIHKSRMIQQEMLTAKDIQLHVLNVWQFITDASLTKDYTVITDEAEPNYSEAKQSIDKFRTLGTEGKYEKDFAILNEQIDDMWDTGIRMYEAYKGDWEAGNVIMDEFDKKSELIINTVAALVNKENEKGAASVEEISKKVKSSLNIVNMVFVVGLLIGAGILFILWSLSNSITGPLTLLLNATRQVSKGDLSVQVQNIRGNNEVGELSRNFEFMLAGLKKMTQQIMSGVHQLASAAEDLSESALKIVDGSNEQTIKSSQVAAASQQLNVTITDVAGSASGAALSAKDANSKASLGGEIVKKSIVSINAIAESSRETAEVMSVLGSRSEEIGAIIKVIDDIAGQTNLLALNAAIEAARAGEQGRGFAVVADEVRKLAEKTTEATKEIAETVKVIQSDTNRALLSMENEVNKVNEGVTLARSAEDAIQEITGKVNEVSSMINQIATASEEQSSAAEQIGGDIGLVAEISKDTSEYANKIASECQELAVLAYNLKTSVKVFETSATIPKGQGSGIKDRKADEEQDKLNPEDTILF